MSRVCSHPGHLLIAGLDRQASIASAGLQMTGVTVMTGMTVMTVTVTVMTVMTVTR